MVDTPTYIYMTLTPSVKYGNNGYIEIVAPSTVIAYAPFICTPITGFALQ
jgi:hypothetical protein